MEESVQRPYLSPRIPVWRYLARRFAFIEPETICVDTSLMIHYTFQMDKNNSNGRTNIALTDRGGLANLNHTYLEPNLTNPQVNADLWERGYKAAELNNVYTGLWYNVTDASARTHSLATLIRKSAQHSLY